MYASTSRRSYLKTLGFFLDAALTPCWLCLKSSHDICLEYLHVLPDVRAAPDQLNVSLVVDSAITNSFAAYQSPPSSHGANSCLRPLLLPQRPWRSRMRICSKRMGSHCPSAE